jgi:hypothetical protein
MQVTLNSLFYHLLMRNHRLCGENNKDIAKEALKKLTDMITPSWVYQVQRRRESG